MDISALQAQLPAGMPALVEVGAGDYATAFQSGEQIVLLSRSPHAARCLKTVTRVSPALAHHVSSSIPAVTFSGELNEQVFVVYALIPGEPLGPEYLGKLNLAAQNATADAIGQFLSELHTFPIQQALDAGAVQTDYPFAFLEEELRLGEPAELYAADLDGATKLLNEAVIKRLAERLDDHLLTLSDFSRVLLHGEISKDHIYFDMHSGKVTGFIDLNGLHVGHPARDLIYLFEEYGEPFTRRILSHLHHMNAALTLKELHFLKLWHSVIRMNWMHQHGYERGVKYWRDEVGRLL